MQTAKRLESINEYYFSQKLREIEELNKQGKNIINLGIGSPDLPPHPDVIKTLQEESAKPNVHAYQSYKGSVVLRKSISDWYKKWYNVELNPDTEILPLIGSKEGIMHICMTYFEKGLAALVPNPGYPTYSSAVKLSGATPLYYHLSEENNYTRFLILKREDMIQKINGADKASVSFHTDHSRGSLARVLTKIAEEGINLSKLQSFPIPDTDFKYSFHADMEFQGISQFEKVIQEIKPITEHLKIYGVYKRGEWK